MEHVDTTVQYITVEDSLSLECNCWLSKNGLAGVASSLLLYMHCVYSRTLGEGRTPHAESYEIPTAVPGAWPAYYTYTSSELISVISYYRLPVSDRLSQLTSSNSQLSLTQQILTLFTPQKIPTALFTMIPSVPSRQQTKV